MLLACSKNEREQKTEAFRSDSEAASTEDHDLKADWIAHSAIRTVCNTA